MDKPRVYLSNAYIRTYKGKPVDFKLESETQEEFEIRRREFLEKLKSLTL